jgi:HEAT repeat protein
VRGIGSTGVFTTDRDLVIRSWDSWLAATTGISEPDASGRALAELFPDIEHRGLLARLRQVVETGSADVLAPAFHAYLIPCPPRTPSVYFTRMQQHVTITPIRAGSHVVGVAVTIEDVTARRERERDLTARLESPDDAVRLNAVRSIATADHREAAMLAGALGDQSWRVRRAAADGLAQGHDEATRDLLLTAVRERHRDPAVLNAALTALVHAQQDVVPPLVDLLQAPDSDAEVRTYSALALGLLEDARAVSPLIHALGDSDDNVRFHAIEALGRIRSRAAALPIALIAETREFSVAFAALDTLARIGEPSVAPRIVPLLDDALLEGAAAEALGRLGSEEVVEPLLALVDRDPNAAAPVAAALWALGTRLDGAASVGAGSIADLTRAVATPQAARAFVTALESAGDAEAEWLATVVASLQAEGVERALANAMSKPAARRQAADVLARRGGAAVEPLLEALASDDEEVRKTAAAALGRIGSPTAVPALIALLDEEADVAVIAAGALGAIGDERALRPLLALLDRSEAAVRQTAVSALSSIGHPDLPALYEELFADESPRVREGAARVAGYFGDASSGAPLLALCSDPDEGVRRTAIEQLAHLDDPRALHAMRNALATGTSGERDAAVRALAHIAPPDALPYLLAACDDHDPWVRYYAARSLGHLGSADAVPVLAQLAATDAVPPVRIAAVEALAELRAPDGFSALESLASDPDPAIARQALFALGNSGDARARGPLLDALHTEDRELQLAALDALGRVGGDDVVPAVAPLAAHAVDASVRDAAFRLLARLGSGDAVMALIALAADPQRTAMAVDAMANVGESQIAWLARGLEQDDPAVRSAVIEALGRSRHQGAEALLARALQDGDEGVRLAAEHALARRDLRAARESAGSPQRPSESA